MEHKLKLSFFIKKCSIVIENTEELTDEGNKILALAKSGEEASFEECKSLLKESLSVLYLPGNVYELEEVFVEPDEEIVIDEFDIDKIYTANNNTLYFSISGKFKIEVNKVISSEDDLRSIEEELDGNFDSGIQVDFNFFDFERYEDANRGDTSFSGHEGLGVRFEG